MPSSPIRMVALDMDGTLLSTGGLVTPRTQAALRALAASGTEIVIATGRRHTYALRQLRALLDGLSEPASLHPAGTLISSNGAVTRALDTTLLHRAHLSRDAAERLIHHLGDLRDALVITFDNVSQGSPAQLPTSPAPWDCHDPRGALVVEDLANLHSSIGKWMEANAPSIEHLRPIEQCLSRGAEPIQMMLCGTVARMRHAEAVLRAIPGVCPAEGSGLPGAPTSLHAASRDADPAHDIALHRTEYPERDLSIVDILPAHTSKGSALRRLLAARGLDPSNLMSIGDNWNDLPMLHLAGHPVLMGNAPADLLDLARREGWPITATNDQEGVALALEPLLVATPEPALTT